MKQDPRCVILIESGRLSELKQELEGRRGPVGEAPPLPPQQDSINLFCRDRAPGIHEIPSLCDIFVSCSVAGEATVIPCPNGTRFNPEVLNCDHSRQYECFEPGFDGKISNL